MKTISNNLKTHLAQSVTSVCTCWSLLRRDGAALYFTDHDSDITFAGNTYLSSKGYVRTAIASDTRMTVDNMEVFGILNTSYIDEHDLRNGVYDYAKVEIFLLNWQDLSQGKMTLRKGFFGEVSVTTTGSFKTEIRGLTQALTINFGKTISAQCRADFGDPATCKMPITPPAWTASVSKDPGSYVVATNLGTLPADPAGGVIWYTVAGGTTGSTQPSWSGSSVSDGTVTWVPYNSFTKYGTVVAVNSRKQIKVSGLTIPQNELYGPNANALGVGISLGDTTTPGPIVIPSTFNPGGGGTAATVDAYITLGGGSSAGHLNLNTAVPGGGGLTGGSFTGNGTNSLYLFGSGNNVNAIMSLGATWTNPSAYTDTVTLNVTVHGGGANFTYTWSIPFAHPYYKNATLIWVTGPNAGKSMEVNNLDANDILTFWLSMPFLPGVGDVFKIYPGCDHLRSTCRGFGNAINFHGEADLPGQDFLFAPNLNF